MASTTTSQISSTAANAAAAADNTLDRAVQGAHSMVDRVADKAGPAVDRMRDGLTSAGAALQNGVEELTEMQKRWVESSRSCVREHPLTSVGIAIAAGLVLSRLLRR